MTSTKLAPGAEVGWISMLAIAGSLGAAALLVVLSVRPPRDRARGTSARGPAGRLASPGGRPLVAGGRITPACGLTIVRPATAGQSCSPVVAGG